MHRTDLTSLGMSDIHNMMNDWVQPKMSEFGVRCTGHEGAGVVVKLGKKVSSAWKVGDRVGIKPLLDVCHNCESCWNGRESAREAARLCDRLLILGELQGRTTAPMPTTPAS